MIVFDLRCAGDHVFEVWFRSGEDYEAQRARGLIACPLCGDTAVGKAVMAPNVAAKGNRAASAAPAIASASDDRAPAPAMAAPLAPALTAALASMPPAARELVSAIAAAQAATLPQSRWVGDRFASEARAAHESATETGADPTPLHGTATRAEAEALAEDGIAALPLLVPVVPPDVRN